MEKDGENLKWKMKSSKVSTSVLHRMQIFQKFTAMIENAINNDPKPYWNLTKSHRNYPHERHSWWLHNRPILSIYTERLICWSNVRGVQQLTLA